MLLRLIREDITDGTTTVVATLSTTKGGSTGTYDTYFAACTYKPRYPEIDVAETRRVSRHGGDVSSITYRNVPEVVSVRLSGTVANMLLALQEVDRLAADVIWRQEQGTGDRVWVEYRTHSGGTIYRSEILSLRGNWGDRALDHLLVDNEAAMVEIEWLRRYYWEATTQTEIPIKKSTGSYATGGVNIENHDDSDAGDDNWVEMQASDLSGSLPFPPVIRIRNTEVTYLYDVYVAHRAFADTTAASNFTHVLEGEDGTGGTDRVSASASGGNYKELSGTWTSDQFPIYWALDSASLKAAAGEYYRVLAFFYDDGNNVHDPNANYQAKLALRPSGGANITETGWTQFVDTTDTLDQFIQELGTIQIPPYLQENISDIYALQLLVTFENTVDSGSQWLNLDFLMLAHVPGFRHLITTSFYTDQNVDIYDDHRILEAGGQSEVYTSWPSKLGNYVGYGEPFLLDPTKAHRLYFLYTPATINHTAQIRVYYYPRFLFPTS